MNDPMWDLADLSVEAGFGPEQDRAMMEVYYGTGLSSALYSRLEVYKAMSDLHWSVWGIVQHAKGNPAENFRSYGLERLGRSKARMSDADFGRHLGVVRTGGLQLHCPYSDAPALKVLQNPTFGAFEGRLSKEGGTDVPASWTNPQNGSR